MKKLDIFPEFKKPQKLFVLKMAGCDWHTQFFLTCLQGLINRKEPRIFLVYEDCDKHWLEYYKEKFNVEYEEVESPATLIERFTHELNGYILYDDEMLDTINIATTIGGTKNVLPISPQYESLLKGSGLKKFDDLRGRWRDRLEAYNWAFREIWNDCNHRILGNLCTDYPFSWLSYYHQIRDYLIASRAFVFHLSVSRRDKKEFELFNRILGSAQPPGCVLGWHCNDDAEKEYVSLSAKYGYFVLCSARSPNFTVHSAIKAKKKNYSQTQRLLSNFLTDFSQVRSNLSAVDLAKEDATKVAMKTTSYLLKSNKIKVENKVYVTFYCTDGDALWAMNDIQHYNWLNPRRGSYPFNWGILPLLYELAPGMLQYFYETKTENDYFASPSSGAGYTYSFLHPDAQGYLEYSKYYLQKTGQIVSNMVNWDTNYWWREVDCPESIELEKEVLSDCIGLVCGLGGSAFATSYLGGRIPKVHSVEVVNGNEDVADKIKNIVKCTDTRPLFLFVFAQIARGFLDNMYEGISALQSDDEYRIVLMDEFMLTLKKAIDSGKVGSELYPQNEKLQQLQLIDYGKKEWKSAYKVAEMLAKIFSTSNEKILEMMDRIPFKILGERPASALLADWEKSKNNEKVWKRYKMENLADVMGYNLIYTMWSVIRTALNINGFYANYFGGCVEKFCLIYSDVNDVGVINEIWRIWQNWEKSLLNIEQVKKLTSRMFKVVSKVNTLI